MNRNGGVHRIDRPAQSQLSAPVVAPREPIPDDIRASLDTVIPPRNPEESQEEFDRRANATIRNKESTHAAFPLPSIDEVLPVPPRTARFDTPAMGMGHATMSMSSISRAPRLADRQFKGQLLQQRRLNGSILRSADAPVAMNNSASAYASGTGGESRDLLTDFADDAAETIRATIDRKVGTRIDFPPGTRTPKTADPIKYRGQDDHDFFTMEFLEKLLGWMRAGNFCGEELDSYRVILLQGYVDGEAHRWYVSETNSYAIENEGETPLFAEVICAMHRRFVKSSSAQRATRAFDSVTWSANSGPEKLYSDLKERGQHMIEAPDAFTMRSRFLNALPTWISRELKLRRGFTAELSDLEKIRTHARQIWEVNAGLKDEAAAAAGDHAPRPRREYGPEAPRAAKPARRDDRHPNPRPETRREDADKERPTERMTRPAPNTDSKGCYSCGGTDHFARDKQCPKYSERHLHRERPRVAAHRVVESYSDEYTDTDSPGSEQSEDEHDPKEAPDLDALIAAAEDEDIRLSTMREYRSVRYYSMRIVTDEEEGLPDDQSVTSASSITTDSSEEGLTDHDATPVPFGNYNPGPICIACPTCSLVSRQVPATPENGLPSDQVYTVCEHLAGVGLDPRRVLLPESPRLSTVPLPGEAVENAHMEEYFEGTLLNWLGDPDFELGIIVDVTTPMPVGARSATEETQEHDRARVRAGLRPLTALEYHVNVWWLTKYRDYSSNNVDELSTSWEEDSRREFLQHPQFGGVARAQKILHEVQEARFQEARISERGPDTQFVLDPAQKVVAKQLGIWARAHSLNLQAKDRKAQAVITRRLVLLTKDWFARISDKLSNPSIRGQARHLWEDAYSEVREMANRLSTTIDSLKFEMDTAIHLRDQARIEARATSSMLRRMNGQRTHQTLSIWPSALIVTGHEDLGVLPLDEAAYWAAETPFSRAEIDALSSRLEAVVTVTSEAVLEVTPISGISEAEEYNQQIDPGSYTWEEEQDRRAQVARGQQPHSWRYPDEPDPEYYRASRELSSSEDSDSYSEEESDIESSGSHNVEDTAITNTLVLDSYDSTREGDIPASPGPTDELLFRSIRTYRDHGAEQLDTFVDRNGIVYWVSRELPCDHVLHPQFRSTHNKALNTAIREHARESRDPSYEGTEYPPWTASSAGRDYRGYYDAEPRLFPGEVFHHRLASLGPEDDDGQAVPGAHVQFLAARVEHSSSIRRPGEIGLMDQPTRPRPMTACISALVNINGTEAYALIDSGSTTNSISPEFANATRAPRIKLDEQVTLQLGCVGSRSRINYGTRVPVDFGGIRGHVYFDQVNLDRYDCIIGTPFLNRHGAVIDFGKREL
ncbi:hypothetical protein DFH09DRAFT_1333029 [Mycena vulgaris]|nr:hypothetical protein DFH09DRAFT_1333029 [Mycena vulgaris]